MIHASKELIEAMMGGTPASEPRASGDDDLDAACGGLQHKAPLNGPPRCIAWAMIGWAKDGESDQDLLLGPVTCPHCLARMRLATDPVRWDYLEERGLVAA